jgi:peptidoglycan/xylan/chitin deacetylase (PgdA/CDA1 family)
MRVLPALALGLVWCVAAAPARAQELALTFDDGPVLAATPRMSAAERNAAILAQLRSRGVQALFFVTLKNGADRPEGQDLLRQLSEGGQLIANHTVTHPDFNAPSISLEAFESEVLGCDAVIKTLPGYRKLLRFPFLREGSTEAKRDGIRTFLSENGYRVGYVSIDTSDWLVDQKLREALTAHPDQDLGPWRALHLAALWDNAQAYDALARLLYGRTVKHVLLLHHNLLNALFIGDVIDMFRGHGWTIIGPDDAFADAAYQVAPMIPRLDGSVLETSAQALGVPLQPALKGLRTERRVGEEADQLLARP